MIAGTVVAERYEIERALGQGSFGRTFLARDRETSTPVAIKLLDRRAATDWKAYELFEREAAVLRALRHQGIPAVHALVRGEWEGAEAAFLVMELVDGDSLAHWIEKQHPLDPADVQHLFLEMLGILDYLHSRVPPILHRDIKPANVIVRRDGLPTLVDFGSVGRAVFENDDAGSTIAGTYGYMPYEQYMGQATPSSDLYALAATFLHLVTGRSPRAFMTEEGRIQVPAALPGDPRLRQLLAKMLSPSPTERYASARDVRRALLSLDAWAGGASEIRARADSDDRHPSARSDAGHAAAFSVDARAGHRFGMLSTAPGMDPAESAALLPTAPAQRSAELQSARAAGLDLSTLPPTPRQLEGPVREMLDRAGYSARELMDSSAKRGDKPSPLGWALFGFISIASLGLVPLVYFGIASARRRRLKRFFERGLPGVAEVMSIDMSPTASGENIARVAYRFQVEGVLHRDVDRVLPRIALRWTAGDLVQILYLPEEGFDSVIVAAG